MKKFRYITTAFLFLAFTVSFLIFTLIREKGVESYQENRPLAGFPSFSLSAAADGNTVNEVNTYITDHFAGRSYWMSAKGYIDSKIGEAVVNDVYIGDNMLLDISKSSADNTAELSARVNDFAAGYDGTVYFAAIPSSTGVYGDILPEYLTYNTEKDMIDRLYSQFESSIRKIDAYNILKMLNDNYIYYRNDSKWTSYGAYCVYRTVIQKLGFLPIAYDKYTIEHITADFRGNLYNKSQYTGTKADMLDIYSYENGAEILSCTGYDEDGKRCSARLYDKKYIGTNDEYRLYLGDEIPLIKIRTDVNNEKKLLVVKDDYANCFIPFLTQHYSEIAVVSAECLNNTDYSLVDIGNYEQTLFLFGINELNGSICLENLS